MGVQMPGHHFVATATGLRCERAKGAAKSRQDEALADLDALPVNIPAGERHEVVRVRRTQVIEVDDRDALLTAAFLASRDLLDGSPLWERVL